MKGKKRNNAVGKKGRSGRKSAFDEKLKALVVQKSWERIKNKFEKKTKTTDDEKQLDIISLEIAKKTIPQEIKGDFTFKGKSNEDIKRSIVEEIAELLK